MVHLHITEICPDFAMRLEISSVLMLEKLSSFPQRSGQFVEEILSFSCTKTDRISKRIAKSGRISTMSK